MGDLQVGRISCALVMSSVYMQQQVDAACEPVANYCRATLCLAALSIASV